MGQPCHRRRGLQNQRKTRGQSHEQHSSDPRLRARTVPFDLVTLSVSVILGVCLLTSQLTPSPPANLFTRSGVPRSATSEHSLFCTELCFSPFVVLKGL